MVLLLGELFGGIRFVLDLFGDRGRVYGTKTLFFGKVFFECTGWMDWVIFFSGVLASVFENDTCSSGMVGKELGKVVCLTVNNNPARVFGVVLLHFGEL